MPKPLVTPGRLDELALLLLKEGLRQSGNPGLRIAAKMAEGHISQALTETLGPATKAGETAAKIAKAAQDFERAFFTARAQIEAEDAER